MAYIELSDITVGYSKDIPILSGFDLQVEEGKLITLLGPSGCGKTTTLRTIAGFLSAQQGRVYIDGRDVTDLPPNKRDIGLVFQNYALFPHLSVFDNVAFGLKMRSRGKEEIRERVNEALAMVGLAGMGNRLPTQLSGGQKQRVALSRALVIEPKVLLLDEPLSNLDAKLRLAMRDNLKKVQRKLGITMIYVTHDQEEALNLSDKIVVMNEGEIEQVDAPQELFDLPGTSFVAKFMGYDNTFTAEVEAVERERFNVRRGESVFQIPLRRANGQVEEGDTVDVYFRPDQTRISEEWQQNALPGTVQFKSFLGNKIQYLIRTEDEGELNIITGREEDYVEGRRIHVIVDSAKVMAETREG